MKGQPTSPGLPKSLKTGNNSTLCNKRLKSQIIPTGEFTARASVAKRGKSHTKSHL